MPWRCTKGGWVVPLAAMITLAGCDETGRTTAGAADQSVRPSEELRRNVLAGRWSVEAFDGAVVPQPSPRVTNAPRLEVSGASYFASAGCNDMGGLGVQDGSRFHTAPAPQTVMACNGELAERERVLGSVLRSSPLVSLTGADHATLSGAGHRLLLRRTSSKPSRPPPPDRPVELAGTRWTIISVNGAVRTPTDHAENRLEFRQGEWTADLDCHQATGGWRPAGDRVAFSARAAKPTNGLCRSESDFAEAVSRVLSGETALASNGINLLIAGSDHWLLAERRAE